MVKEIDISEIKGFRIGNAENVDAGTGCTVIICEEGAVPGCDVRGRAPATRETASLAPEKKCRAVHCVMISGGSAFGLAACDGAMKALEEHGIGFDTPGGTVPIVTGACIYDLRCGDGSIRPDAEMGRAACEAAFRGDIVETGNRGAGTGATVGKLDQRYKMKGGLGICAVKAGSVSIGAVSVVNSFGNISDPDTGMTIAGMTDNDGSGFVDIARAMYETIDKDFEPYSDNSENIENTCITCIITDADLSKTDCSVIASAAHNGYAKTISPVHTTADGDAVFVLSNGDKKADTDTLCALAAEITAGAIKNAVMSADSAYGVRAACDL